MDLDEKYSCSILVHNPKQRAVSEVQICKMGVKIPNDTDPYKEVMEKHQENADTEALSKGQFVVSFSSFPESDLYETKRRHLIWIKSKIPFR